jgi:hypothetical protein
MSCAGPRGIGKACECGTIPGEANLSALFHLQSWYTPSSLNNPLSLESGVGKECTFFYQHLASCVGQPSTLVTPAPPPTKSSPQRGSPGGRVQMPRAPPPRLLRCLVASRIHVRGTSPSTGSHRVLAEPSLGVTSFVDCLRVLVPCFLLVLRERSKKCWRGCWVK